MRSLFCVSRLLSSVGAAGIALFSLANWLTPPLASALTRQRSASRRPIFSARVFPDQAKPEPHPHSSSPDPAPPGWQTASAARTKPRCVNRHGHWHISWQNLYNSDTAQARTVSARGTKSTTRRISNPPPSLWTDNMSVPPTPTNGASPRVLPVFTPLVCVVDFHHARGPEVEKWFGVQDGHDPAAEYDWTLLPFMALSDGAHAWVSCLRLLPAAQY